MTPSTTMTYCHGSATQTLGGDRAQRCPDELLLQYRQVVEEQRLSWTVHHRLIRPLGSGGQGVVFLSERHGTDSFTLPVALKVFSPERYDTISAYDEAMAGIATISARVATIQHHSVLRVLNWLDRYRIRIMEMEWINGFDLARLLTRNMFEKVQQRVSQRRWRYINEVIATGGPVQPRLKPGIAIAIIRDCLSALAALHRGGIVHGDLKPSNVMLERTGHAKIIDFGSAFELEKPPPVHTCTPTYAAPEVLENHVCTPQSDLASLGYVLVEMLAGKPPFEGLRTLPELLEAKRLLAQRLPHILPPEVVSCDILVNFCRGLIAPDPMRRFPCAESANFDPYGGAASIHRSFVKGDLATEYDNEIRLWLQELDESD